MTRLKPIKVGDTVSIRQRGAFVKLHGELVYIQPENKLAIIADKDELERFLEMAPEYRTEEPVTLTWQDYVDLFMEEDLDETERRCAEANPQI